MNNKQLIKIAEYSYDMICHMNTKTAHELITYLSYIDNGKDVLIYLNKYLSIRTHINPSKKFYALKNFIIRTNKNHDNLKKYILLGVELSEGKLNKSIIKNISLLTNNISKSDYYLDIICTIKECGKYKQRSQNRIRNTRPNYMKSNMRKLTILLNEYINDNQND